MARGRRVEVPEDIVAAMTQEKGIGADRFGEMQRLPVIRLREAARAGNGKGAPRPSAAGHGVEVELLNMERQRELLRYRPGIAALVEVARAALEGQAMRVGIGFRHACCDDRRVEPAGQGRPAAAYNAVPGRPALVRTPRGSLRVASAKSGWVSGT